MVAAIRLTPFSETKFDHSTPSGLPVSSPSVDLSVTWDGASGNVLICRPRDEVVSKIHQGGRASASAVTAVKWKSDGQFIAVAWDDGYVRLMGLENNKAAHTIKVLEPSQAAITHIGWTANSVTKRSERKSSAAVSAWKTVLGSDARTPDLPRELTFLEVDTALPKISPLPGSSAGSGEDSTVFTLRTGIDFLFQPFRPEDSEEVSVMIVGTDRSDIHLSIYDSFAIGSFKYQLPREPDTVLRLIHHTSHRHISTHSLLFKPADGASNVLDLVPIDLSFIASSPINLPLLASKLTTLQKLLRYLKQSLLHMQVEYKNTRDLPSRFLANIQEDLAKAENGPRDIVSALYHTLVTGHTYETVKEWLVDSLAERGHKRWDKAVTSGLENLRTIIHQNFLPALERCGVILSRLKGLAQFHTSRDDTGLSAVQISRLADTVSCLALAGHKMLLASMEELDLFASFSPWLRLQIDRLAAGEASSSAAADELLEKEATMDNARVLAYVRDYLMRSPLEAYLADDETGGDWEEVARGATLLEALDAQIERMEGGRAFAEFLPKVHWLLDHFEARAFAVFNDIAQAQKRSVRFGEPTRILLDGEVNRVDSRMDAIHKTGDTVDGQAYTAVTAKNRDSELFLFRTAIPIVNGISSDPSTQCCSISVPSTEIIDVKFLAPTTLLVLLAKDSFFSLLSLPLTTSPLQWTQYKSGTPPPPTTALDLDSVATTTIPLDDSFAPVQMEVHDNTDVRGPLPARVCLLGKDRSTYRVFELKES